MTAKGDVVATQEFAIRNILISHCGDRLTPEMVDRIASEIINEMRHGGCAWAFEPRDD